MYEHNAFSRLPIFLADRLSDRVLEEYEANYSSRLELKTQMYIARRSTQTNRVIEFLADGLCVRFNIPYFNEVSPSDLAEWKIVSNWLLSQETLDVDLAVARYVIFMEDKINHRARVTATLNELVAFDKIGDYLVDPAGHKPYHDVMFGDDLFTDYANSLFNRTKVED